MTADAGEPEEATALTGFQVEVARTFFCLPAADRFLIDAHVALVDQRLTERTSTDLDLFTGAPGPGVVALESVVAVEETQVGLSMWSGIRSQPCIAQRKASLLYSQIHLRVEV